MVVSVSCYHSRSIQYKFFFSREWDLCRLTKLILERKKWATQTQITNLCLCITNTKRVLGSLHILLHTAGRVYDFSVFRSLWYKNTVCRICQVRTYHTPVILRYTTHTREPWPKLADFDTTICHSFLGQIYLIWDAEIHRECLLRPPIKLFCIGGLRLQFSMRAASVKLADLARKSKMIFWGLSILIQLDLPKKMSA